MKIIDQNYGIISYDYYPGNQSYFDYIDAKISYDKGVLPLYPGSINIYSIIVIEMEKVLLSNKFNNRKLFNYISPVQIITGNVKDRNEYEDKCYFNR